MKSHVLRLGVALLLVVGIGLSWLYRDQFAPAGIEAWLEQLGVWGPLVFVGCYTLAPALFLPGSVLTLAGGALFGTGLGALLSLIGATIGATIAFMIARYMAADWVERHVSGRLQDLKDGVEREGWRFVAFTRLVPVFPFNLLNYAFGLTRVSVRTFAGTSFVAMAPGALAYAYAGNVGREAISGGQDLVFKGLLALTLLAAVGLLPALVKRWQRPQKISPHQLHTLLSGEAPPLVLDVRNLDEFTAELGHIEGARLLPLAEFANRLDELTPHRQQTIVTV